MYITLSNETDFMTFEDDSLPIDLDTVMGDIDSCMQSPECTDESPCNR